MRTLRLVGAAAALVGASAASGQNYPRFVLERLMLDPAAHSSLVVGTGEVGPAGSFRLSVTGHWEHEPLVLLQSGDFRGRGVGSDAALAGDVVKDRLTLHVGVAIAIFDRLELHGMVPAIAWQDVPALPGGFPSLRKSAVGSPSLGLKLALLRQDDGAPMNVALAGDALLSTKSQDAFASADDVAFTPRLELGRRLGRVVVGATAGGLLRSNGVAFGTKTLRHELLAGLVLATLGDPFRFEISGRGTFNFESLGQNLEALAGIRFVKGPFEAYVLGGPGFGESPGTPTWRGLFGLAVNTQPATPAPAVAAPPPPPPAPPAPPPPPPDPCAPGNAHTPDQCPDLDDDGDGVPNRADKCPLVKGPPENDGCPDTDRDGDGIPDRLDKCPDVPGTAEYQGCPPPQKAEIKAGKIEIKEKVFFDTGKATIQQRSNALLDDVAQVMMGHPEVTKVTIEGHTDNVGSARLNRKLSRARAEAVRDYLVGKGVSAERLEAKGFGPDRPAASNKTSAGREANRRVEFVVGEIKTS